MDYKSIVMSQTNYSEEEAVLLLEKHDNDYMKIIRDYLGFIPKKEEIKSVNQEIYKLIRKQIDITDYNLKNEQKFID